jgi:hypothetical protein
VIPHLVHTRFQLVERGLALQNMLQRQGELAQPLTKA